MDGELEAPGSTVLEAEPCTVRGLTPNIATTNQITRKTTSEGTVICILCQYVLS